MNDNICNTPRPPKAARGRKSRRKIYKKALIIYLSALIAICALLITALWGYAERFQSRWDITVQKNEAELAAMLEHRRAARKAPQLAFEAWMNNLTVDYWTDVWFAENSSCLDKREYVYGYMSQCFKPESLHAYKAKDYTNTVPVYVLKSGDRSLCRVTLSGSDLKWEISHVEMLIEGTHSDSVCVPDSCRVLCNGTELSHTYCEEAEDYFTYEPLADSRVMPEKWSIYKVDGLLGEPVFTVVPPEGRGLITTPEGIYMTCVGEGGGESSGSPGPGGMSGGECRQAAADFLRDYLIYYMNGRRQTSENLQRVLAHLSTGSRVYKDIIDTYDGVKWNPAYYGISVDEITPSDIIVWADNCVSVDVRYRASHELDGARVSYADAEMRIYLLVADGSAVVSGFEIM